MKKRPIGIALAALCLAAAGMFALWQASRPEAAEGEKSVTVQVVHSGGDQAEFTYRSDGETLGPLLEEEGLIPLQIDGADAQAPAMDFRELLDKMGKTRKHWNDKK